MAKATSAFRCSACGAEAIRWVGRCPRCGEFSTMEQVAVAVPAADRRATTVGQQPSRPARRVSAVTTGPPVTRVQTGLAEFDRVVGGGLVPGQVLLLSGEPGAGKSTLLLAVADSIAARTGRPTLYVSGEESVEQIAVRAHRVGAASDNLLLADETDLANVIGHVDAAGPEVCLVIVDSVQTIASASVDGRAGGVAQVMEVAQALTRLAKQRGLPICLVGQVTKESVVAGPRALEHVVDTTLSLDGDRHTSLRLLRAVKNRYGPADEVACFEQVDSGMREVADPSILFRSHRTDPVPGTAITVTIEGRRAMLAEIQALAAPTTNPNPRRSVFGLDSARTAMLLAVTERTARLRLFDKDVFVATVGGIRVSDPGSDLAACLAMASAATDEPLPQHVAAVGEVTLSGDVRRVPMISQRVGEAVRLGYRRILVPPGARAAINERHSGGTLVEVTDLAAALRALH